MTTPIPAPARYGYCSKCGRPLKHPRSNAHGMGACCWQKHLNSLSEDDRARETMRGYAWYKAGGAYMVIAPEHHAYQVDLTVPACECIAFQAGNGSPCKHILYIRREIGWSAPDATESPESPQNDREALPAVTIGWIDHHYATVRDGAVTYHVCWVRPYCACPSFRSNHEICPHIRAAQDEAHRLAEGRQAQAETLEEKRARVKADIDEIFDER